MMYRANILDNFENVFLASPRAKVVQLFSPQRVNTQINNTAKCQPVKLPIGRPVKDDTLTSDKDEEQATDWQEDSLSTRNQPDSVKENLISDALETVESRSDVDTDDETNRQDSVKENLIPDALETVESKNDVDTDNETNRQDHDVKIEVMDNKLPAIKILEEWTLKLSSGCLAVEGHIRGDAVDSYWRSSVITHRTSSRFITSSSGQSYELVGFIEEDLAAEEGFPQWMIAKFRKGFPVNWKKLFKKFMEEKKAAEITDSKSIKASSTKAKKVNISIKSCKPAKNKPSKKKIEVLSSAEDTESTVIIPSELPCTRSGRTVKPPAQYWVGQQYKLNWRTNEYELERADLSLTPAANLSWNSPVSNLKKPDMSKHGSSMIKNASINRLQSKMKANVPSDVILTPLSTKPNKLQKRQISKSVTNAFNESFCEKEHYVSDKENSSKKRVKKDIKCAGKKKSEDNVSNKHNKPASGKTKQGRRKKVEESRSPEQTAACIIEETRMSLRSRVHPKVNAKTKKLLDCETLNDKQVKNKLTKSKLAEKGASNETVKIIPSKQTKTRASQESSEVITSKLEAKKTSRETADIIQSKLDAKKTSKTVEIIPSKLVRKKTSKETTEVMPFTSKGVNMTSQKQDKSPLKACIDGQSAGQTDLHKLRTKPVQSNCIKMLPRRKGQKISLKSNGKAHSTVDIDSKVVKKKTVQRKPKMKKSDNKKPTEVACLVKKNKENKPKITSINQVTGGKGTLKRKMQLKELMEYNMLGDDEDDDDFYPFNTPSAAFKRKKIDLGFGSDLFDLSTALTPGRPVLTPRTKCPHLFNSYTKTPESNLTPAIIKPKNTKDKNLLMHRLQKERKAKQMQSEGLKINVKSVHQKKQNNELKLTMKEVFAKSGNTVDDDGSSDSDDFYFSD